MDPSGPYIAPSGAKYGLQGEVAASAAANLVQLMFAVLMSCPSSLGDFDSAVRSRRRAGGQLIAGENLGRSHERSRKRGARWGVSSCSARARKRSHNPAVGRNGLATIVCSESDSAAWSSPATSASSTGPAGGLELSSAASSASATRSSGRSNRSVSELPGSSPASTRIAANESAAPAVGPAAAGAVAFLCVFVGFRMSRSVR